ncbi:MAG: GTP-binding protein, partial [Flavitalea sp.]
PFNHIIIETVGVGQSEIDIASLADIKVVVLVPEAGDEIQSMKSGLMEIADVFVINKSDRPDADKFARTLENMLHSRNDSNKKIPVIKAVGLTGEGMKELYEAIHKQKSTAHQPLDLITERAYQLIQKNRMKDISKQELKEEIRIRGEGFNLYKFVREKITQKDF